MCKNTTTEKLLIETITKQAGEIALLIDENQELTYITAQDYKNLEALENQLDEVKETHENEVQELYKEFHRTLILIKNGESIEEHIKNYHSLLNQKKHESNN